MQAIAYIGPDMSPDLPPLHVLIAAPRGFCAGVDRAIKIVELSIERFGPPVYVRHEIVHNKYVVDRLRGMGAVFVEELDEVPDGRPVVFSAHGVPKVVPAAAQARGLDYVDATCPLVSKVHRQAQRLIEDDRHILFIGHAGHPEVIGTMGQVEEGRISLIETLDDAYCEDLRRTAIGPIELEEEDRFVPLREALSFMTMIELVEEQRREVSYGRSFTHDPGSGGVEGF